MPQTVTPELRQWIIEQSSSGCRPEAVLAAMVQAGWQADVAEAALEQTLLEHLQQLSAGRNASPAPAMAAQNTSNSPVPGMCGKNRYLEYTRLPVT